MPRPPVRIVHLGLGALHRAHQAWYTAHAGNAAGWGIASFTGRRPAMAEVLSGQDGLYTIIERSSTADRHEIITSLAEAEDGANISRLAEKFASPDLAVVTITVTEAGYRLRADGSPDTSDAALVQDLATLHLAASSRAPLGSLSLTTMPGRLLAGLEARRRANRPGIAVVPCDNLPANGSLMSRGTIQAAEFVSPGLAEWITQNVSFVSTSVDRITPRTTAADAQRLNAQQEWVDAVPVVTEPFRDLVPTGLSRAGRPHWEDACCAALSTTSNSWSAVNSGCSTARTPCSRSAVCCAVTKLSPKRWAILLSASWSTCCGTKRQHSCQSASASTAIALPYANDSSTPALITGSPRLPKTARASSPCGSCRWPRRSSGPVGWQVVRRLQSLAGLPMDQVALSQLAPLLHLCLPLSGGSRSLRLGRRRLPVAIASCAPRRSSGLKPEDTP